MGLERVHNGSHSGDDMSHLGDYGYAAGADGKHIAQ